MDLPAETTDPLPSWNDGAAKEALIDFISRVTSEGSREYLPPSERIAVFDHDGTICNDQPVIVQFAYTADRILRLAPDHPEWRVTSPFREILNNDMNGLRACGLSGITGVLAAAYAGMTTGEFDDDVLDWLATARHPETGQPYTEMVYLPMVELIQYLHMNNFLVYIVSASGIDFLRTWAERVYGIPPQQVIGSNIRHKYEIRNGEPVLVRLPVLEEFDEGAEKPVAIHHFIGRRPVFAFGDSDGDLPMLEWVAASGRPHFAGVIHHSRAAYSDSSSSPNLRKRDSVLGRARADGWIIINMHEDWKKIFSFEEI